MDENITNRKKIGIALSGGAAWGLAHVGVLQVLEENSIPIDFIAGTSMGSVVGGLYANGVSIKQLETYALKLHTLSLLDFNLNPSGLLNGHATAKQIKKVLGEDKQIEDSKIPFRCIAVDLKDGTEKVFYSGSLIKAIRCSISVPGAFTPAKFDDGKLYVDGGILNNVPDDVVKKMGADIVIAVDVLNKYLFNPKKILTSISILYNCTQLQIIQQRKLKEKFADVTIEPKVQHHKIYAFGKKSTMDIIRLGREAAEEQLPKIKELLNIKD